MRRVAFALVLLVIAAAATFVLHGPTLAFGFDYDDYHFVRPHSRAELLAAFHGPWDSTAIEIPYYRPLTIAFFALRFEVLGINASAYHALSLILFSLAAALSGWLAWRLTARRIGGIAAVILFVVHPAMPYSLVAWITNQMHLIEMLVVLCALAWWDGVRRRSLRWWLPLLLFGSAAFLIKEDGIMLLPAIVVLHGIRRRLGERDLPPVPAIFIALTAGLVVALLAIRGEALAGTAGRSRPDIAFAWHNYVAGLDRVFRLAPATRAWQPAASWFAALLPIGTVAAWRRTAPATRAAFVSGLAIALLFNAPFVVVTKPEQLHVVALGAVLVLAASVVALFDVVSTRNVPLRLGKLGAAALVCAGVAVMAAVSRNIARDFEPFGPIVRFHDNIVRQWAAVPVELRDYLARKREPGGEGRLSSNPARALDQVCFGVHGPERAADGISYQWMAGPRADILLAPRFRSVTIPLRHAIEAFREPARVRIFSDGRIVDDLVLDTSEWRVSRTTIPNRAASPLWRMHRIVITIDHAWRPSEVIPGSNDGRILGVQIGDIQVR